MTERNKKNSESDDRDIKNSRGFKEGKSRTPVP